MLAEHFLNGVEPWSPKFVFLEDLRIDMGMVDVIADFVVRARDSPLQTALDEYEGVGLEIQPAAASHDTVAPFAWVQGPVLSIKAVESAFDSDPAIDGYRRPDGGETLVPDWDAKRRLYRIAWSGGRSVLGRLVEQDVTVVSATQDSDGWNLRLLFPTREALSTAHDIWNGDEELDVGIERIVCCDDEPFEMQTHGLTDEQYQAMKQAVKLGYYDIPRRTTLSNLADDLGISHQALSERLRRAHRNLVTNTVCNLDESEQESALIELSETAP